MDGEVLQQQLEVGGGQKGKIVKERLVDVGLQGLMLHTGQRTGYTFHKLLQIQN
jgi:hypothetical protein